MPAIKLNFNISAEKHHYMSHHCKYMHQNIKISYRRKPIISNESLEVVDCVRCLEMQSSLKVLQRSLRKIPLFMSICIFARSTSSNVNILAKCQDRGFFTALAAAQEKSEKWLPSSIVLKSNFLTLTDRPTFRTQKGAWPIVRKVQSLRQISSSLIMHTVNLKYKYKYKYK